jgi:phosphoribosylformimino-5-aminoimidazole carboxamide ribotide isomerase
LHIVPVIDLLDGVVVHAKKGLRAHYQAISSSLTHSSAPIDIVKAFMDLYPFETLYIADLNAIQHIGLANHKAIYAVQNVYPHLKLWLDAGVKNAEDIKILKHTNTKWVLGTENFNDLNDYLTLLQTFKTPPVLSLDFLADGYKGPADLLQEATLWPNEVIVMTLNQVGANAGIDRKTITSILARAQRQHVYAAGGVRNINDITLLASMGIHGVLMATALHNKAVSAEDLSNLQIKSPSKLGLSHS